MRWAMPGWPVNSVKAFKILW